MEALVYKIINLTKFKPGARREDVLAWWRGPHADLAKATPGMVRYVQSHWSSGLDPATGLATGHPGAFDGHAEHWFVDEASYRTAMASEEWQRCIEDGPRSSTGRRSWAASSRRPSSCGRRRATAGRTDGAVLDERLRALCKGENYGVLTTLFPDGRPNRRSCGSTATTTT